MTIRIPKIPQFLRTRRAAISGVILLIILIAIGTRLPSAGGQSPEAQESPLPTVSTIMLSDAQGGVSISATGDIVSEQKAALRVEASGQVTSSPVRAGDYVERGSLILTLSNADLRAQVSQAQAALDLQEARLADTLSSSIAGPNGTSLIEQQNTAVTSAYQTLLNTGLAAYPQEDPEDVETAAPTISGTYTGNEEGAYIIETYRSGTSSGASFRLSGLEEGFGSVSTTNPTPLGTQGLYILFPNEPTYQLIDQEWVVAIPNTRASGYLAAKNAYDAARESRTVSLQQSVSDDLDLSAQRAQVAQARAQLEAAVAQLAKTVVRAPFSGEIITTPPRTGEYASVGQTVTSLVNNAGTYARIYVSADERALIDVGDTAQINKKVEGTVTNIAGAIGPNGKVEVIVTPTMQEGLIIGDAADVRIQGTSTASGDSQLLPLSAVKPRADGSVLYQVSEGGVLTALEVETGSIIGNSIEILSPLPQGAVIATQARGLQDGMRVSTD